MNYYGYSGKKTRSSQNKRRLIINIIIIVLAILGSVAFALVLGNHLKNKIDNEPVSTVPVEELIPPKQDNTSTGEDPYVKPGYTYDKLAAVCGFLDLEGCPDAAAAVQFVGGLKNCGYTGIVFVLKDDDGHFTCSFDAVSEVTGALSVGSVTSKEILSAAFGEAKNLGMKVSVYARISDVYLTDDPALVKRIVEKQIFSELSAMGADEFIFDGAIATDKFDSQHAGKLYEYISELRGICPDTAFGIVIDSGIFENPELTPTLELIYRYTDFFCVDFTDPEVFTDETISHFLDSYSGSFTAYNIRSLLPGSTLDVIQSEYKMFTSGGKANTSFISQKTDYTPVYDEESGEFDYAASKVPNYSLTVDETGGDD